MAQSKSHVGTCPACGHQLSDPAPAQTTLPTSPVRESIGASNGAAAERLPSPVVASLAGPVGPKSRCGDPHSSHEAAERALPKRGKTAWRLMEALRNARGPMSYAELSQVTGINPTTVSTRLTEIRRASFAVALDGKVPRQVKLTRAGIDYLDADRRAVAA